MINHKNQPFFSILLALLQFLFFKTKFSTSTELSETPQKRDMTIQTLILKYVTDSGGFFVAWNIESNFEICCRFEAFFIGAIRVEVGTQKKPRRLPVLEFEWAISDCYGHFEIHIFFWLRAIKLAKNVIAFHNICMDRIKTIPWIVVHCITQYYA